jgi:hypothetical protein
VYSKIADALDSTADPSHHDEHQAPSQHPAIVAMMAVSTRAHAFLETAPKGEI